MIKFSAGYIPHRQAHLIGLGFTDENLHVLLHDNKRIHVTSEDLSLPAPGFDILVFAAADQEGIKRRGLELISDMMTPEVKAEVEKAGDTVSIPCMHLGNTFYLFPFVVDSGRAIYVVGLDDVSYKALRRKSLPTFRVRMTGPGTNVEVLLFWGSSRESMEEYFYASGLVTKQTRVTRLGEV